MSNVLTPESAADVVDYVASAVATAEPLEIIGGGTKRAISPPTQTGYVMDLSRLAGIVGYEPEELILTLKPGTPMAEIGDTLSAAGQMLAFEPPDLVPLLGAGGVATFGGAFGTNFAGPRRLTAGAVRDHMLGLHAVSGRGESFKAGGKVVKNVTGYDLARALCGSWGTLAIATEMTVKVLPRPETETTVALPGLAVEAAVHAMSRAMGSAADVSGAAHLAADVVGAAIPGATVPHTVLRLEGFGPSVAARAEALRRLFAGQEIVAVEREPSQALWRAIRDVTPFVGTAGAVWRISVAPTEGPRIAAAMPPGSRAMLDWAGGLVWVETPATGDAGASLLRDAVAKAGGGHATLIRAPAEIRTGTSTFHNSAVNVKALSERLRAAFDPHAILNPGRLART
ncbi:FAD-binding protein [Acuticoccus sp. I52.16.1]|uniref:FAD-binding protein n=1 Tax=Acuticoccus sp. I52.16.1 TaxID=2928472 RepID=UPI001FD4FE37|nr:FAD-binding protein [Acuticoccus sp. I52.16.1]UOM33699.1 FAD-binding protein [Acuticoccus sp. I52.16.1]